ncbi:hypothetical protein CDCA_CDCA01G0174 [Cyanidium caldarium]|uniref:Transcriptional coactivator p15 (PC4) C-terminal domain-containing protein n=1 Tax=Cyanidium caldarium TaxID=2771 RepID=A0AAV9IP96_CYACA|nr:hypothetical protein CDCA_CDCA01G0174 [Cyanidium caldarium]
MSSNGVQVGEKRARPSSSLTEAHAAAPMGNIHESPTHFSASDEVQESSATTAQADATGAAADAIPCERSTAGDCFWRLGEASSLRRVTVRKYRNSTLVDIREYYRDAESGEERPGKKGISLTVKQFRALQTALPEVDKEVQRLQNQ